MYNLRGRDVFFEGPKKRGRLGTTTRDDLYWVDTNRMGA